MTTKQVIVLRKDLNMRKGKMVAQGAHASMKVFFDRKYWLKAGFTGIVPGGVMAIPVDQAMRDWVEGSFAKICVSVDSEEALLKLYADAQRAGLPCAIIQDSGKTEFHGVPTYTALAIGPDEAEKIDPLTGQLPLL